MPEELRGAVKALSDDKRWAVFIALVKEGEMNFNKIKDIFGAHPQELDRILKSLTSAGLVKKFAKNLCDVGYRGRAFYAATEFGKDFLEVLYYSIMPKEEILKTLLISPLRNSYECDDSSKTEQTIEKLVMNSAVGGIYEGK